MIFVRTREAARSLHKEMEAEGYKCTSIQVGARQEARQMARQGSGKVWQLMQGKAGGKAGQGQSLAAGTGNQAGSKAKSKAGQPVQGKASGKAGFASGRV